MVAAIAVTEPDAGSDVAGLRTRAVRDGDDWVIDGAKLYITNGVQADWLCLLARTSDEGGARVPQLLAAVGVAAAELGPRESRVRPEEFEQEVPPQALSLIRVEGVEAIVSDRPGTRVAPDDREAPIRAAVPDRHPDESVVAPSVLEEERGACRGVVEHVDELVPRARHSHHGRGGAAAFRLAGHVEEAEDPARAAHQQRDRAPLDPGAPQDQV